MIADKWVATTDLALFQAGFIVLRLSKKRANSQRQLFMIRLPAL